MMRLLRSRRGLGTPVANLIVLTAAVLLTTTVTLFAINVTTSQVQKENMYISKTHLWYVNSTYSVGAVMITNTGPSDLGLNKIVIKGLECSWNGTANYVIYCKSSDIPQGDLPLVSNFTNSGETAITVGNKAYNFSVAGDDFTLKSGGTMMFYIALPERLMVYDLGVPVRIVIQTTQAVYCTEALVQTT
jgi:hypothetical protein